MLAISPGSKARLVCRMGTPDIIRGMTHGMSTIGITEGLPCLKCGHAWTEHRTEALMCRHVYPNGEQCICSHPKGKPSP